MPSGTFVEVQHLADTVLFLCSDAASQITGQAIVMDVSLCVQLWLLQALTTAIEQGGWIAQ